MKAMLHAVESWSAAHADEAVFAFTGDLDWAPNTMVADELSLFETYRVPFTPFVTHWSPAVQIRYQKASRVGVHPNFWPRSTHGDTPGEVVEHVSTLVPEARGWRGHSFFDGESVCDRFVEHGYCWDSNVSTWLQAGLSPLMHKSGLVRFPVCWEDDLHARVFGSIGDEDVDEVWTKLYRPGLHVLNMHPQWLNLNLRNAQAYENAKANGWDMYPMFGSGARAFAYGLLDRVAASDARCVYLDDLYEEVASAG